MHARFSSLPLCLVTIGAIATLGASPALAQIKLPRISPTTTLTQQLGLTDLTVSYSRPGVKGRNVWGELVPYDKVWRAGANATTTFQTSDEIQFGGQKLAAGTYGLVTFPGKDTWEVVLSKETDMQGSSNYKPENDVLRVKVRPEAAPAQEWLAYSFEDFSPAGATSLPNSANLVLRWEKLRIAVPIVVDANTKAIANLRAAVAAAKADDWQTRVTASRWALDNDQIKDEGKTWRDQALAIQKNYATLGLQARWHAKEGRNKEAIEAGEKALVAGRADKDKPDMSGLEKSVAEWKAAKN